MSTLRKFTLALIQLGKIGSNKADNLTHAREQILKAALGSETGQKPDVIVLPVRCRFWGSEIDVRLHIGVLQLSVWPRSFSCLRREDWICARDEV